jgi:hypothetical protein
VRWRIAIALDAPGRAQRLNFSRKQNGRLWTARAAALVTGAAVNVAAIAVAARLRSAMPMLH